MFVVLGSWIELISHSGHFVSQMSHHTSDFVAVFRTILAIVAAFARCRKVQHSSLVPGCTVTLVDFIGNVG